MHMLATIPKKNKNLYKIEDFLKFDKIENQIKIKLEIEMWELCV